MILATYGTQEEREREKWYNGGRRPYRLLLSQVSRK
jgi:hypothetical protein